MARLNLHSAMGSIGPAVQNDGTVASGTAGETNLVSIDGVLYSYFVIGTQTSLVPLMSTTGVDFLLTDTNAQGFALSPFSNSLASPLLYTVGTSPPFFIDCTIDVTDWSGTTFMVGFHGGAATMQAHQGAFLDYTDKATIGNLTGGAVDVQTSTAVNNNADINTDTLIDLIDSDVARFRVNVSAAGAVTYNMWRNGVAQTLTTVAYSFDTGDVVTPFVYSISHTETATTKIIRQLIVAHV
jgi:hypothetical protein